MTSTRSTAPWWEYARKRLLSGEFPLWNPHVFGGMPYYTNPETSLFYPVKVPFSALPFSLAAPLVLTVNAMIGSMGFFALLRHMKLSPLPATIGAVMFAYGSFMSYEVHIPYVNTIVWFPWQLLLLLKLLTKPTAAGAVSLGLITACSFLGGSPEIFFICQLTLGIMVFYRLLDMAQQGRWKGIGGFMLSVAAAAILVVGLTAVALFPVAEFSSLSLKSGGLTDPFFTQARLFQGKRPDPLSLPLSSLPFRGALSPRFHPFLQD